MSEDTWVPPSIGRVAYDRLTSIEQGFPDYMRGQVNSWVFESAGGYDDFDYGVPNFLSLKLKKLVPEYPSHFPYYIEQLADWELANVLDCMLYFELGKTGETVYRLGAILELGLSEWAVSIEGPKPRLTHRIPTGVQVAYEALISKTALAGQLLAEAFEAAYGTTPNPNHCYDLCVKAVETLASPRYIPNNTTRATLGAVISHLQQKTVSLPLLEKNTVHKDVLTQLMRVLWEGGQRHGDGSYEHVSLKGAKTAHALATSLVAMIHEDLIGVS